jgi:hypothetical protein
MEDLTTQAIDMLLDNNAVNHKIINPLKRKAFPYLMTVLFFNVVLFILVCHLVRKISKFNAILLS